MKSISHFHVPVRKPEDIIPYLGKGERHWRKGYSAYELAHAWLGIAGFPDSVSEVLRYADEWSECTFIDAFFERDVDLGTPGFPSQSDLMVITRLKDGIGVVAIEGKVEEPFGPLVQDWLDSEGKQRRLNALCKTLNVSPDEAGPYRYQLFHRTASAVYEAQRYGTNTAMMLVHSFSATKTWFDDFAKFSAFIRMPVSASDTISNASECEGVSLRIGWVSDQVQP